MKKFFVSMIVAIVASTMTVNAQTRYSKNHRHHDKVIVVNKPSHHDNVVIVNNSGHHGKVVVVNNPGCHDRVVAVNPRAPRHSAYGHSVLHRPAIGTRYAHLPSHAVRVVHRGHTYWRTPDGVVYDRIMTTAGIVYSVVHLLSL